MGASHSTHSSPSSSRPSTSRKSSSSTFEKPPTRRIKSWSSRSSSSSSPTTPTSYTLSPSLSPTSEDSEFTLNTRGRDYDVKARPLRVGYPYYEDVLWEAELASRRGCGKEKKRRKRWSWGANIDVSGVGARTENDLGEFED
ncbi:hypothetical protein BDZ45DRAFT_726140 [Acephala macrosclerotiorum]|nr:hypothetical protein BDZ45DRAFT_726140 [Acephala macrosclerotiorum]